ncbi:MAG: NUDIX hydrolase [Prevotellaceae bacterium]|jgi:8-oxo-dGTP diphosphatase|nr:NUDIX hydrolase [Prevotellaceae bacterium]
MGNPNLTYDNQAISIDCTVFGFDGANLRVLLVRRRRTLPSGEEMSDLKLPGSLISDAEDLPSAANRVMRELIGGRSIYLKQMEVFSDPQRVQGQELTWINSYYGVSISRVLTVAFFAFVKLDDKLMEYVRRKGGRWVEMGAVKQLALDHNKILVTAIDYLLRLFQQEPVAFEFLPRKFTLKQLQTLYEIVFDVEIDNRNFRKKILSLEYILPVGECEEGVAHKPAQYYTFDRKLYKRQSKGTFKLNFVGR